MCLDSQSKPENLDEAHMDTARTCETSVHQSWSFLSTTYSTQIQLAIVDSSFKKTNMFHQPPNIAVWFLWALSTSRKHRDDYLQAIITECTSIAQRTDDYESNYSEPGCTFLLFRRTRSWESECVHLAGHVLRCQDITLHFGCIFSPTMQAVVVQGR